MNVNTLTRTALSVAITTPPERRQMLISMCPKGTFKGLSVHYNLGKFFATDTVTENFGDIAKATGLDPVALVELTAEDESFRPLSEHLIRLLSAHLTTAQAAGEDVTQWAVAIARITEAAPTTYEPPERLFITAFELVSQTIEIRKLIGKIIERGTTGQMFGPSGDGKSFNTLAMAFGIATGGYWNCIQCQQGLVLYFAGEGHSGLKRRVRALSKHHGEPDLSRLFISRSVISFDAASIRRVNTEARELEATTGEKVALIVIDTLARHLIGDENTTRDMSEFVRAVDGLRDAFPESAAVIVHHSGNDSEKSGRSRGSSSLKAAMDFEIQCMGGVLTFTKLKDGEPPAPIEFKLQVVDLGADEDGEPITSCVVQYGERSAKNREEFLTANERMLMELLHGHPDILSGDLRSIFFDRRRERDPDAKYDTIKKAFARSLDSLIDKKKVFMDGNVIKEGQRTNKGHSRDMSLLSIGTDRDTTIRGVPVCPSVSPLEIPTFSVENFEGWK